MHDDQVGGLEMDMDHVYLEALQNYLLSSEWWESINIFVTSNCGFFSNVDEYHPEQYKVWKNFQDVSESILQNMLLSVGCSMDELESAIEAVQRRRSNGPREELVKDILDQLLSFQDFQHFAKIMYKTCNEELGESVYDIHSNNHNQLMRMGFAVDNILSAIDKYGAKADLEVLVNYLGDLSLSQSDSKSVEPKRKEKKSESKFESKLSLTTSDTKEEATEDYPSTTALQQFIQEAYNAKQLLIDYNDLRSKYHIATGVIETYKDSSDSKADTDNLLDLVQWAVDLIQFLDDLHESYYDKLEFGEMRRHHKEGLIVWYEQLEEKFVNSNMNNLVQQEELERLRLLDSIASQHDEEEQYLHSCISNYDKTYQHVNKLYKKCSIITLTSPTIFTSDLEEVYLYLKKQMNGSEGDIEGIYENLYQHPMLQKFHHTKNSAEILQLLLDLLVLENELIFYKHEIQRLIGSPGKNNQEQAAGNGSMFDLGVQDMLINFNLVNDLSDTNDLPAPDLFSNNLAPHSPVQDAKSSGSNIVTNSISPLHEPLLNELKEDHRQALRQLKQSLQDYKQRALSTLEERLYRKKLLLKQMRDRGEGGGEEEEMLAREISHLEKDLDAASNQLNSMQENLLEGYRDKCIFELNTCKQNIMNSPSHLQLSLKDVLTSQEKEAIDAKYAEEIRQRYQLERNKLLADHENKRVLAYNALQKRLQNKNSLSGVVTAEEILQELEIIDDVQNQDLQEKLRILQDQVLVQLGSTVEEINSLLDKEKTKERDDYLDDLTGKPSPITSYLSQLDQMKLAYSQASAQLADELLSKRREMLKRKLAKRNNCPMSVDELHTLTDELCKDLPANTTAIDMIAQVVLDSYTQHFKDPFPAKGRSDSAEDIQDRVRVGILESFEKSKAQLNDYQSVQRQQAEARLQQRRAQQLRSASSFSPIKKQSESAEEADGALEGLFEDVMDSYLEPSSVKVWQTPAYLMNKKAMDDYYTVGDDKDKREKIKLQHEERQKALDDDLYANMIEKKKKLEDRVRRKREKEQRQESKQDSKQESKDDHYSPRNSVNEEEDSNNAQNAISDMLDSLTTSSTNNYSNAHVPSAKEDYSSEARRISTAFAEEQQKHDLLMKIQHTRQKQLLQKKLWERNQHRNQNMHEYQRQHLSDIHDNITNAFGDDEGDANGNQEDIQIGAFKSRIPSQRVVHQPVVKGLSLDKIPVIAENKISSMSRRGLNLTPLQRK